MPYQIKAALSIVLISLFSFHVLAEKPWQPVSAENNVILHKREQGLGLIEVRAQTVTQTSLIGFLELVHDTENLSKWVSHAKDAVILEQISSSEFIVQTLFSAPWPASNRYMVTYSHSFMPDENTLILNVSDTQHSHPEQKGMVRITDVKASWKLQKLNNGMTHISYTAYANPQGLLPTFLANKITLESVQTTFENLKKRLPLYQ